MGSGISVSRKEFDKQEHFVRQNFDKAKKNMSQYKRDGHNRYNDTQIQMKLRQEYYKTPYNKRSYANEYVTDMDWKTWNQ